ncbi:MAG: DJ-1/PfpI/YhbO family deglycase/protease [Candidatus Riflebacteria bacterium]|nr:DJ-1/PfpI/YhbO family deglycase/protease [Candidatus Riflebacteria bacterium]
MGNSISKSVAILIGPKFQEDEALSPKMFLTEKGIEVKFVGLQKGQCQSKGQAIIEIDLPLDEAHPNLFDGLIIPGGGAPEVLRQNKDVIKFTRSFFKDAKPVGSICHGPQVLISAGLLLGRTITCYSGIKDDVINSGAIFLDQEVVIDGNLVTSRTPGDLPAFNKAFWNLISRYDRAKSPWMHASPTQVIEYAIFNEIKSQAMYEDLAKKCKDKVAKAKFKYLAETEKGHKEILSKLFENFTQGKKPCPKDLGETDGEGNFYQECSDDIFSILRLAIASEESSQQLYSHIAEKVTNQKGKKMFENLAEEESQHRRLLEAELTLHAGRNLPSAIEKEPWWSEGLW